MKKSALIVATLCLTSTGCVKHQEETSIGPPPKAITFQTAKYRLSRATEEQIAGSKFTYDHFVTHAWSDAAVGGGNVFMDHQRIEKNEDETAWIPTVDYYWPTASTVDFISYYPENTPAKTCPKVERNKLTYTGYDVSGDKADIDVATNDLMYAEKAVGYSGNIDRVNDDHGGGNDSGYSGVPTLFHHALAQLEIRLLVKQPAGETESHWEAVIDHAALTGYYTKGNLELALNDPTQTNGLVGWTPVAGDPNVGWTLSNDAARTSQAIVGTGAANPTLTVSSTGTGTDYLTGEQGCRSLFKAFVLPQTLTETHFFDLKFTLNKYRGSIRETSEADRDVRHILLKTDAVAYWGMNQRIVYTIVIDPAKAGKLSLDPAVADWTEVANDKSADDRVVYYIQIPTEEQWETSNVWHVYDENDNRVAEIAKELIHDSRHNYYQAVVVNPVKNGVVDLKKGFIVQVSESSTGDASALAGGTVSCITASNYRRNRYTHTITMGNQSNYDYCMLESGTGTGLEYPTGKRAYTNRPYTVMDNETDRNIYPVVRMGSQYWLRENLRATHYNDGTTALHNRATTTVGKVDQEPAGSVRMFEDKATYAFTPLVEENEANLKKYGYLYNFRAVAGADDGEPHIVQDNGYVEWKFPGYQASALLAQQGVNGAQEGNKQLCPAGWHIPTLNSLYSYWPDVDYLDEAVLYWRWRYAGSVDQPLLTNTSHTFNNWSGFSLNLIPAYEQAQEDFTINRRFYGITIDGSRVNGCIPFWNSWLYRLNNGLFYSAIFPLCIQDNEVFLDAVNSYIELEKLNITGPMSYPVRCMRNQ